MANKDYKSFNGSLIDGTKIQEELTSLKDRDITNFTLTDSNNSLDSIMGQMTQIVNDFSDLYKSLKSSGELMDQAAKSAIKSDWYNY